MSYESRRFRRAEMANELAHEDAENDRERPNASQKSRHFKEFMSLKRKNRSHTEDLEFQAFKRRYGWF